MPRSRRARRGRLVEVQAVVWRHLCGLPEPGDEHDPALEELEFFGDPAPEDALWAELGAAATVEHARVYPGCRPALWWRFDAPEPERRKVSGSGRETVLTLSHGLVVYWKADQDDPPLVESEADYLARLGLLLPGERPPPEAFGPEPALLMEDLLRDDDDDPPPGAARPARQAA
jgi:hypothetical protein